MNYLEISKIFNKMINNVRSADIDICVSNIKKGLTIDKNVKK